MTAVASMSDSNTSLVFSYLRDVYALGGDDINSIDPEKFIEKVKRTHRGLSAEHEFAAIASWLGKCSLLTQLDEALHSSGKYRVPDFLVVVKRNGKEVPFLVEVKTDSKDTCSGKHPRYTQSFLPDAT